MLVIAYLMVVHMACKLSYISYLTVKKENYLLCVVCIAEFVFTSTMSVLLLKLMVLLEVLS